MRFRSRLFVLRFVCELHANRETTFACRTITIILFNSWSVFLKGQWDTSTFITSYIPVPFFFVILGGAWWYHGFEKPISASNMDFVTGIREIEDAEEEEKIPTNLWDKIWAKV